MKTRMTPLVFAGIVALALGVTIHAFLATYTEIREDRALRILSDNTVSLSTGTTKQGDGKVYLCVDNTSINYQLAQPTEQRGNSFYLCHDYDGEPTRIGCPFIDYRTSANAKHVLVYAHGIAGTTTLFSELKQAHTQNVFQSLGSATLTLEDGTQRIYKPLMALSVSDDYQLIQTFSFTENELKKWLLCLQENASTYAPNIATTIRQTRHVLTLVTCTSPFVGQPERTLVIFGG